MTRQAPNEWSARLWRSRRSWRSRACRATPCDQGIGKGGDDGGLVWRFCVLVGIMIVWVPLYLAWARRSGERERI